MAQFVVRNLEQDVHNKLRARAQDHGHSVEEEVREILRAAVLASPARKVGLGSRIAERFGDYHIKESIKEHKGRQLDPPEFDE